MICIKLCGGTFLIISSIICCLQYEPFINSINRDSYFPKILLGINEILNSGIDLFIFFIYWSLRTNILPFESLIVWIIFPLVFIKRESCFSASSISFSISLTLSKITFFVSTKLFLISVFLLIMLFIKALLGVFSSIFSILTSGIFGSVKYSVTHVFVVGILSLYFLKKSSSVFHIWWVLKTGSFWTEVIVCNSSERILIFAFVVEILFLFPSFSSIVVSNFKIKSICESKDLYPSSILFLNSWITKCLSTKSSCANGFLEMIMASPWL